MNTLPGPLLLSTVSLPSIRFSISHNAGIMVDSGSQPCRPGDAPMSLARGFTSRASDIMPLCDDPSVTMSIEGKFVGRTIKGSRGAIGTWAVQRQLRVPGALPQIRMLPACLTEMLPIVFREPGGNGLKRAWHCLPFEADRLLPRCMLTDDIVPPWVTRIVRQRPLPGSNLCEAMRRQE